jgi:dTDP-4-dehydrorhamnose 3,5-epimerase-like enzyme
MVEDVRVIPEIGEVEFDFSEELLQTKFPVIKEPLIGVRIIKIIAREDDRGFLLKDIQSLELPKDDDGKPMFGEHYHIFDPQPIIRGLHAHREYWDYFCVVFGKAKFSLFDVRKTIGGEPNPTYGNANEYLLSERNPGVLVVPPGIYHGHHSYLPNTLVSCVGTHLYNPENPDEVRVPYMSFGYNWGVEIK